jgi:hypothetical protein
MAVATELRLSRQREEEKPMPKRRQRIAAIRQRIIAIERRREGRDRGCGHMILA